MRRSCSWGCGACHWSRSRSRGKRRGLLLYLACYPCCCSTDWLNARLLPCSCQRWPRLARQLCTCKSNACCYSCCNPSCFLPPSCSSTSSSCSTPSLLLLLLLVSCQGGEEGRRQVCLQPHKVYWDVGMVFGQCNQVVEARNGREKAAEGGWQHWPNAQVSCPQVIPLQQLHLILNESAQRSGQFEKGRGGKGLRRSGSRQGMLGCNRYLAACSFKCCSRGTSHRVRAGLWPLSSATSRAPRPTH